MMPSVEKAAITADLVSGLIRAQFPQWAGLPVRRVESGDPGDAIATRGVIAAVLAGNLRA